MASIVTNLTCELTAPVSVVFLPGNMFSMDNGGNIINVFVVQNGEPVALGGSISANVIRSDGTTVAITGAFEGNKAYVILPQACYAVPGIIHIVMKITEGTTITTIAAITANVYQSSTDAIVDPGTLVPSVAALIEAIEDAVDSIPVDYSGLLLTLAKDYSTSKTYIVGEYAWQAGVLKRCIVPITTAESYTAAHWTNAILGDDVTALKSALQLTADGSESIDISGFSSISCVVSDSNTLTRSAAKYRSRQFAPNEFWKKIAITANPDFNTHVTFVTEALPTTPTSGTDMSSALCTGETGRHVVTKGTTETVAIPSDCAYIVIAYTSNGNDVTPSSVVVYTEMGGEMEGKQDLLTFDNEPIPASENPVKSGGVYKAMEKVVSGIGSVFQNFIQKSISSSTGKLTDTGAENCITNSALIPIDAIFAAKADVKCIALYLYADDGSFIRTTASNSQSFVGMDFIESVLADSPTAKYVRVRFGNSTNPVTLQTYGQMGVSLILMQDLASGNGHVTFDSIAGYGNEDREFTSSDENDLDFSITVPFNGDTRNQIFTCNAKYEQAEGVTDVPTIIFRYGETLNRTTQYILANKGDFTEKQWRVIRYPGMKTALTILFHIPVGVTVTIKDFYNTYTDEIIRTPHGIRFNGHQKYLPSLMNPDTLPGVMMAVKCGACAMIQIPKRLSDGTWIFYHDDSLVYNDTYIRQADGTALPSTYDHTLWKNIDFETANSWDWGISKNSMFTGTKPMTMEQFFTICGKTGIMPMLSIHPWPSSAELGEIKAIARKCGVLNRLGIKCLVSHIAEAYAAFGNDIESYTVDVSSGTQTASVVNAAISAMDGLSGCTVRRVIELFANTAYNAYFGESTYDPFKLIADAGYVCSLAMQTGTYHPTLPNSNNAILKGTDIEYWQNKGVSEYTYEYDWSNGLNW